MANLRGWLAAAIEHLYGFHWKTVEGGSEQLKLYLIFTEITYLFVDHFSPDFTHSNY